MSDAPEIVSSSPLLVNAETAATMLGVGTRFLWSLTAGGQIPVVRLSKRAIRYSVRDLEAWIASRSSTKRVPAPASSSVDPASSGRAAS